MIGVLVPFLFGIPGTYLDRWDAAEAVQMVVEQRSPGPPVPRCTS